jgi:hypothetical protein
VSDCARPRCGAKNAARAFCQPCEDLIARKLESLPGLWQVLNAMPAPVTGPGERVSGSREPRYWAREGVWFAAEAIVEAVQRWGLDLCKSLDWEPLPWMTEPGLRPAGGVRWLSSRLSSLLAQDTGPEVGMDILRVAFRASRAAGADRPVECKTVPCPGCDAMGLRHRDGDDHVKCSACNRVMSLDEYDQSVGLRAAYAAAEGMTPRHG